MGKQKAAHVSVYVCAVWGLLSRPEMLVAPQPNQLIRFHTLSKAVDKTELCLPSDVEVTSL